MEDFYLKPPRPTGRKKDKVYDPDALERKAKQKRSKRARPNRKPFTQFPDNDNDEEG